MILHIVHIELAGFYSQNMSYQTNLLAECNLADGHQVTVVSSTFQWEKANVVYTPPSDTIVEDGIRLIRLPYRNPLKNFSLQKIRAVVGLHKTLEELQPDVILVHCLQSWSIMDVIRYKKEHPEVKLYADTHVAAYNSGKNWVSLHFFHRGIYRYLTQRMLPYLEKYFYVGTSERDFAEENYGVPHDILEYYPLGGYLLSDREYAEKRNRRRDELNLAKDELLLVHSGKLDALKRTEELLQAFAAVPELKAKLAIIGSIPEDMKPILDPLMAADGRVQYLGWKSGSELQEYLCACDLYCQPGGVSATMQNSVCCGCPVMAYPHKPYTANLDFGNILWVKTQEDMADVFRKIAADKVDMKVLRAGSEKCAKELLDYRALAARLYR